MTVKPKVHHCKLDRETRTVSINVESVGEREIRAIAGWLRRVEVWIRNDIINSNGGSRWVFSPKGDGFVAQHMDGKMKTSSELDIVTIRPRKELRTDCCDTTVRSGTTAWRPASGQGHGHSRARFCDDCVRRGGPRTPASLRLVQGGLSSR